MKDKKELTFKDFQNFKFSLMEMDSSQSVDVFTIIFNTGLRISEVLNLKFSDVDFKSSTITITSAKMRSSTRNQVSIILNDECMETLRKLKDKYPKDVFVFQSRKSKNQKNKPASSISRQVVTKSFKTASNSTCLPISIQSLRESYAVQAFKKSISSGCDSASLSKIMGHVPTSMTKRYVKNCNIKNDEELSCLSAPKVDFSKIQPEIIEYLLNGTSLNKSFDLDDICQKCDISESDLIITLKTMKILRGYS
tara:strand:- start:3503 stop:4258 length:756 start_codon:yes stop_codon:yes gene_type:complete